MNVRIYGPQRSPGSFRVVARGFVDGLAALGVDHWFCPTDIAFDEDGPGGGSADIGVLFGLPQHVNATMLHTAHKRKFFMYAPNQMQISADLALGVHNNGFQFLAPSEWAASVIRLAAKNPVYVVRHGVGSAFKDSWKGPRKPGDASTTFLHVTSTASDRKGTLALLAAWRLFQASKEYRDGDKLVIYGDSITSEAWRQTGEIAACDQSVQVISGFKIPPQHWPSYLRTQYDCVIQPSRCEGFGLVPLEAMCCGVPVIATRATGHTEFLPEADAASGDAGCGNINLTVGPEAPVRGEFGLAMPSVDPVEISLAMRYFKDEQLHIKDKADAWAESTYTQFTWERVVGDWLKTLEKENADGSVR